MKIRLFAIASVLFVFTVHAQKETKVFKKEIQIVSENDAFMLKLHDGYYTNGIFLQFSKAKGNEVKKKIERYELSQAMFTTGDRMVILRNQEPQDRPFCGYLQLKYTNDWANNKHQLLSWYASLGATGELSLAQAVQDNYHKLIKRRPFPLWETQMPNAIGINTGVQLKQSAPLNNHVQLTGLAEANLGMVYTNAKVGGYITLGLFENTNQSALFNTRIGSSQFKRKCEIAFYAKPVFIIQGYNATTQGMLGFDTKDAITSKPNTLMYQQTFGLLFANQRITTRIETNWQTKETSMQFTEQRYASIQFAYRM